MCSLRQNKRTDLGLTDLLLNSKLTKDYLCASKLQEGRAGVSFNLTRPEAALTAAGGMQCPLPDHLRERVLLVFLKSASVGNWVIYK